MTAMQATINLITENANKLSSEKIGDYEKDGLLICGKCHTPKQTRITVFEQERIVGCLCECAAKARDEEYQRRKQEEEERHIRALRINGIQDRSVRECTFSNARQMPMIERAKRYVEKWDDMYKDNIGLIFWGNTGNGKTYTAACIANALIDKKIPVLVTSFSKLLAAVTGMYSEDRIHYLESLSEFKLLVIDDLGAERQSEFALEQVYSVIDQRYKSKLPIIITTNISMEELKNPKNMDYQRIYDRVLEMCVPMHFTGESMRKQAAAEKFATARELLSKPKG